MDILGFLLFFLGLCWRGGRSRGAVLLLVLLQLQGSDLNHRVGVDFALGGGPGDILRRVGVSDGCILDLPI